MESVKSFFVKIKELFPEVDFAFVPFGNLGKPEQEYLHAFMSSATGFMVVFYPVKKLDDYIWYYSEKYPGNEFCKIDLQSLEVLTALETELAALGFLSKAVPCPENSGLQFRYVALASSCGELGDNAFYLHPEWGTRVHLRVLATDFMGPLFSTMVVKKTQVCTHCGLCHRKCPAHAFEKSFDGLKCRSFRKKRGEYEPRPEDGQFSYCRICMEICPAGRGDRVTD